MILTIPYLHRTLRGYSGIQISSVNEVAQRKEIGSFRLPWWIGKLTESLWSFTLLQDLLSAYTNREAQNYTRMITKLTVIYIYIYIYIYQSTGMYRMRWFLAVLRSLFHSSLSYTFSCHSCPPTILLSSLTSSSHLFLGLPLGLVVSKFIYNTLLGILFSSILCTCPNHRNLCSIYIYIRVYQPPHSHLTGKIYRHNYISSFCRHLCKFLQPKKKHWCYADRATQYNFSNWPT